MKPTSRIEILKALQEKKISQTEAFDALKKLQQVEKVVSESVRPPVNKMPENHQSSEAGQKERVAIVGLSGKFPGAADANEFWQNIKNGVDSVTEIPENRWSIKDHYDQDRTAPEKTYSKWQGLIDDIEYFDPLFFNLSPREASYIDPQQRLFLEECWKTFEDAGFVPEEVMGTKCGVYVGAGEGDYIKRLKNETTMPYTLIGNSSAILSARISYLLNLKGPSMSINTACSGSLVAIHLAIQSILSGECKMALAGGVYLQTSEDLHIQTSKAGMLSEDGRCKAFDQSGNGFVPAEGVGVVLLKKLSEAERDGDHIYAVIKGSAINQDGSTNGITAPSAESQRNLEIGCYQNFGINPEEISYVECHGTGTKLGDPIEIDALTGSFNQFTKAKQFCAIGSVKTNIGHALSAAGVAGVIKVLMAMKHGQLVPSLHFQTPNKHINFTDSPFYVNTELKEWKPVNGKRIAAISSFGFSGTNAHLVLEDYPVSGKQSDNEPPAIIPLSAKSEKQLLTAVSDLKNYLGKKDYQLDQISYTLQTGRRAHEFRVAFMAWDISSLEVLCLEFLEGKSSDQIFQNNGELTSRSKNSSSDLNTIARNWVEGQVVDWKSLYKSIPQKVSLPTYPFEKVRCWIERKVEQVSQLVISKKVSESQENQEVIRENQSTKKQEQAFQSIDELKNFLRRELASVLFIEESKITDPKEFSKIGLDSVVGVEVVQKINDHYKLQLEAQVFYDCPTIESLANLLAESLSEGVTGSNKVAPERPVSNSKEYSAENKTAEYSELKKYLKEKLSSILFLDQHTITDRKEFSKIGLDSVVGVELINSINTDYDLALEASCLYEYKNLQLLTEYIAEELGITDTIDAIGEQSNDAETVVTGSYQKSVQNTDELKTFLRTQLSEILFLDEKKIGDKTKFSAIGLDSVVGVELVQKINDQYDTDIEAGSLYDYTNLEMLAKYLSGQLSPVTTVENKIDSTVGEVKPEKPVTIAESKHQVRLVSNPVLEKTEIKSNGKVQLTDLSSFVSVDKSNTSKVKLPEVHLNKPYQVNGSKVESKVVNQPDPESKASKEENLDSSEMAIVGLSGKYPESKDLEKFWKNLRNSKNCITEVPKERWDFNDYFSTDKTDKSKTNSKWGGFIADADKFSPLFFNLSPREAENMDPQERLLLEVIWSTVEDAGYTPTVLNQKSVGVFIGNMINQYSLVPQDPNQAAAILNNSNWSLANRLSFFYDFKGPSLVINTACSSSLTAIYMACESIKRGECQYAVAGGVNLNLHPSKWVGLSNGGMIGTEGKSQSLGSGEGYVPGEGVGTVLIKTLADAIADQDHIYGVIKGGYINHGGRSTGFTVPNQEGQTTLATAALKDAGVSADQIDYIETASNGSQVGDPIEMRGLQQTFKDLKKSIPIGTVKSNIGHCEAASGISQVTKVLLQYKHHELVPSINAEPLNPAIDLNESSFYVQNEIRKIEKEQSFNTLVNSFGAGGSNAQLVISKYLGLTKKPVDRNISRLVVLSGEDQDALKRIAGNLVGYINKLSGDSTITMEQLAYTLQVGRQPLECRMTLEAGNLKELSGLLKDYLSGKADSSKVQQSKELIEEQSEVDAGTLKELINQVNKGGFQSLIGTWLSGGIIDWKVFYGSDFPQKASLPTYPFKGESYWAGELGKVTSTMQSNQHVQKKAVSKIDEHVASAIEVSSNNGTVLNGSQKAVHLQEAAALASDQKEKLTDFIKGICCELLKIPVNKMSAKKPFSAYGIDSIMVKDISMQLEKALGTLPKTLFFQCANIEELVDHLIRKHQQQVNEFLGNTELVNEASGIKNSVEVKGLNFLVNKSLLDRHQKQFLNEIGEIHFANGYLLDIWTSIYIAEDQSGYLHTLKLEDERVIYGASYIGKSENEIATLTELNEKAEAIGYKFCYWSVKTADRDLEQANNWISTPVGLWQNIEGISDFKLEGGRMKKLRYMVKKFENLGDCRTIEYNEISEQINTEIKEVVMEWCEHKKYVHSVKPFITDLNSGNWKERYRIFLTYQGETLQNIILIGQVPGKGYLMDQEYYRCDMPTGGTEFTVSEIIRKIASEGSKYFSLGMTWVLVKDEYVSDNAGYRVIQEADQKETFLTKVFENADKNLQYKNKFRPVNTPSYFYRSADSEPELLIRFLSLFMEQGVPSHEIADLLKTKSDNPISGHHSGHPVSQHHVAADVATKTHHVINEDHKNHFDVSKVDKSSVRIDLMSDSWVYFRNQTVKQRIGELISRVEEYTDYQLIIDEFFGFDQVQISQLGRVSEKLFFRALGKRYPGKVFSNLVFYTTAHHIVENGFQLEELPHQSAYDLSSNELFRGGIDLEAISNRIREGQKPSLIFLEICNNGAGGYPVSMSHLKALAQLSREHEIPLVLDSTRIVRNAVLVQQHEQGYADRSVTEIIAETCQLADMLVGSLSKDFCVNVGGIIAVRDQALLNEIQALAKMEGGFVSELETGIIGESIRDFEYVESAVRDQLTKAGNIYSAVKSSGLPIVSLASGHCLLIPVNGISPLGSEQFAKEILLKKLWEETGIRGGIHIPGQQYESTLNDCIRLCLPLGLTDVEEQIVTDGLMNLKFAEEQNATVAANRGTVPPIEPMAIIGMSGKYGNAENADELWQQIITGESCTSIIDGVRKSAFDDKPVLGGFMKDVDMFDPLFFNISPKEAKMMDPQQRLMLEKSWEAMEDSGYTREQLSQSTTGVFIAIPQSDYLKYEAVSESAQTTGTVSSIASSRISHIFNLQGPSEVYNTNCSSSFVALHRAIQSIRLDECDQAIVGGVQVIIGKEEIESIAALGVLSPSGTSLSFDHKADGYVRSEGVGAIIVKPLAKAEKDGDHIYAVVKGTAVGHGGTGLSLTAPSAKGMADVMKKAYKRADVDARTVQYVEAHGISAITPDAIEIDAIQEAYMECADNEGINIPGFHCKISTIKPVLGHAEFASGMAIITKAVKALQNRVIPGIPGFERLNDEITLDSEHFDISAVNKPWNPIKDENGKSYPRRVSLNSYGTGGVNAHIIIEEYNKAERWVAPKEQLNLFVLSADDKQVLRSYADAFLSLLRQSQKEVKLVDLAYTLQKGREARSVRMAILFTSRESLIKGLQVSFDDFNQEQHQFLGNVEEISQEVSLPSDEEIEKCLVKAGKSENDYAKLAIAWTNGVAVAWEKLYENQVVSRLSLPTYPFDKKSYWISSKQKQKDSQPVLKEEVQNETADQHASKNTSFEYLQSFMVSFLSEELELEKQLIKTDKNMIDFGVDSIVGQKLGKELLESFGIKVKARDMLKHQTIDSLAKHISDLVVKTTKINSEDTHNDANAIDEITLLEKFKNGELSLEEVEKLV